MIVYCNTNSILDIEFIALLIVITLIFLCHAMYVLRMSECSNQSGIELGYNGGPAETLRDFPTELGVSTFLEAFGLSDCPLPISGQVRSWTTCPRAATRSGEVHCCISCVY